MSEASIELLVNKEPQTPRSPATAARRGTPLDDTSMADVLGKLPPLQQAETTEFRLREASLPTPRTGADVREKIGAPDRERPDVAPSAPRVTRITPTGTVAAAAKITVTFDQPVMPLGWRGEPGIELAPPLEGEWRCLGTNTFVFEPEDRLPGSTRCEVRIPAGLELPDGRSVPDEATAQFETSTLRLLDGHPKRQIPSNTELLVILRFDQRIDPAQMFDQLQLPGVNPRLGPSDVEALRSEDARAADFVTEARPSTWIALRFEPRNSGTSRIVLAAGATSSEGELPTPEPQHFDLDIAGPFTVERMHAGECRPEETVRLDFTNPIDPASVEELEFEISPAPESPAIAYAYYKTLVLDFAKRGETTYTLSLPGELRDIHGQRLSGQREFSVTTTASRPLLRASAGTFVTIHADAPRLLPMQVTNIDRLTVSVYEVQPEDWFSYLDWAATSPDANAAPPGRRIDRREVELAALPRDTMSRIPVDVSWALPRGETGHRVVTIHPTPSYEGDWRTGGVRCWVQSTRLATSMFELRPPSQIWVNDLASGAPRAGCSVATFDQQGNSIDHGLTNEDGTVHCSRHASLASQLVARDGDDQCMMALGRPVPQQERKFVAHVFDDRGIYRPAETVTLAGWVRRRSGRTGNDLQVVTGPVRLTVLDAARNEIVSTAVSLDAHGCFHTEFELPGTAALGSATVTITIPKLGEVTHQFDIQEFRRPEYEVSAQLAEAGPHLLGEEVVFASHAAYYTGEALADVETSWEIEARPTNYVPPGWSGFRFGRGNDAPWLGVFGRHTPSSLARESSTGRTDANGDHQVGFTVTSATPPQPVLVTGDVRVTDINRQTWAAKTRVVVHPSKHCVGLRTGRGFVSTEESIDVDVVVTDLDGRSVAGRQVVLVLERGQSKQVSGEWTTAWREVQREVVATTDDAVSAELRARESGVHRIVATTADAADRVASSEASIWVAGARWTSETLATDALNLIPQTDTIEAPATAQIAVAAPFQTGHGQWLLTHESIIASGSFELDAGSATLDIDITEELLPTATVLVSVVGIDEDGAPAQANGEVELTVSDRNRRLDVETTLSSAEVEPGGRTTVQVSASRRDGRAAAGAVATVWVVDEAILSLTDYATPDPIGSMYPPPVGHLWSRHSRTSVLRNAGDPDEDGSALAVDEIAQPMYRLAAPGAGFGGGAAEPQPIAVRTNFDPLAAFVADVVLDGEGRASVDVDLPDSLTRYRVMVNAALEETEFGRAEASLTARLPLTVRPSPPRFANFGDAFEFGVVVHNASDARCDVDVALRSDNLELEHGDHAGQRVTLGPDDRAEVRFQARTRSVGEATYQVVADTVTSADAASGSLPIYTPATTEAFATYGTIDDGVVEHVVVAPEDAVAQFGGLEITTSSTALQALTDAVVYLANYRFDCAEQRASRILALTALRDVLDAFESEDLPPTAVLDASVRNDLESLARMQMEDGGWGFWVRGQSWPFVSTHVVLAMVQARESGIDVKPHVLSRGLAYLDQIERHLTGDRYSLSTRLTLRAYAAFARTRAGLTDTKRALAVVHDAEELDEPPLAAAAWCLAVLHGTPTGATLAQFALNRVSETESTAVFADEVDTRGTHLLLASNRRTDAVLLWALMDEMPESDLIGKIVHGLLAHRTRGRWRSTQENAQVLLALQRYFRRYEATTPDFVARAWLGDRYAGEHQFAGRTTERHHITVPMATLQRSDSSLILQKDGAGRMYYRLGMKYAPRDLELEPLDRGFVVARNYEAVDDPADVGRRDDDTWVIRAGARVRVRVTMVAAARRHHVALVDPLPAGLEALNPALAVTEKLPADQPLQSHGSLWAFDGEDGPIFWWLRWQRTWFDHQNLRDERAEAFTTLLWEGHHEYVYHARATTIGEFVVPPPRAEEMYSPEVFGRGGSDRVVVTTADLSAPDES